MPCLKMASNSDSGSKVSPSSALNLEFICQAVSPAEDQPATTGHSNGSDGGKEEEEEEEEEEETDMVTALRNARAKAIAKAAKQLAIEDGTYKEEAKAKKEASTPQAAQGQVTLEQSLSYWRPDRTLGGSKAGSGTGSRAGTGTGGSPSEADLKLLECDLRAQSVINDGECQG